MAPEAEITPIKKLADVLEPQDALTLLRFKALAASAQMHHANAQRFRALAAAAQTAAEADVKKAAVLISPVNDKYGIGANDTVDDETFTIERAPKQEPAK